ncbi:hypothetical protein MCCPILRI181_00252 [Mycoplasma capricolum subsp. capripneumoniae]|nr:hypothetical protein Mccp14020TZ_02520 [Mycoplasma capricolum subsp. capripneumoniae]CEA10620.1 hypothetical protein MCCPILRI181_00252 [Mycoplasma capricolum subsp. capripneumoniae]CEA11621.1 hypothetical protein MCCPF38_00255 [Mycoplasma capricolum subsp. capripneumoniae]
MLKIIDQPIKFLTSWLEIMFVLSQINKTVLETESLSLK